MLDGPGRVLSAGMALLAMGMLVLSRVDAGGSWAADVLGPSLMCACGIGFSFVSTTILPTTGTAPAHSGLVTGLVNTAFQIDGRRAPDR